MHLFNEHLSVNMAIPGGDAREDEAEEEKSPEIDTGSN